MMQRPGCSLVFFALMFLTGVAVVFAQSELGNITGVVTDPSGAVIPGAEVTVTNPATNLRKTTISAEHGEYNIPVSPGSYQLTVTLPGFKRFVADQVVVSASATVRIDAKLEIGASSEVVDAIVEVAQVQTENAKISTSVQNKLVDELPLVVGGAMRSPFDLVSITPESRGSGSQLALGGGQTRAWEATLDGISVATNRTADA